MELMDVYSIFVGRKTQDCQDFISFHTDLLIQCDADQTPRKLFCGYQQIDSKVYSKSKRPRIANKIFKGKNKVGGLTLPDVKIY